MPQDNSSKTRKEAEAPDFLQVLWQRTKQRKTIQIAAAYLAGGFALLQLLDIAFRDNPIADSIIVAAIIVYIFGLVLVIFAAPLIFTGTHYFRSGLVAGIVIISLITGILIRSQFLVAPQTAPGEISSENSSGIAAGQASISGAATLLADGLEQPLRLESIEWFCSFDGSDLPDDIYTFSSDRNAESALNQVLQYSGLSPNFLIQAANVGNAVAVVANSSRYILYSQDFMRTIAEVDRDWAAISVLAHEVGHHVNGHALMSGSSRTALELDADRYSGFLLQKMGATIDQAQAAMKNLILEPASETHPARSARLAAITNGWIESCEQGPGLGLSASNCPSETLLSQQEIEPANESETNLPSELDISAPANYGNVELQAGVFADPHSVEIRSGGSVDASYLGQGCRGYATRAPDIQLTWRGVSSQLQFSFEPEGDLGDTTLLVNRPDNTWACNDDRDFGSRNPLVEITNPSNGVYDIWVGSYNENVGFTGTLIISDRTN